METAAPPALEVILDVRADACTGVTKAAAMDRESDPPEAPEPAEGRSGGGGGGRRGTRRGAMAPAAR